MEITFILLTCIVFAFICFLCFKTLNSTKDRSEIIISVITTFMMLFLTICVLLGAREMVKHKTMQDYCEGKVEIIEQIDTIRTFKFN